MRVPCESSLIWPVAQDILRNPVYEKYIVMEITFY